MSDNPEIASLTRMLMEIQREQRDTATGNPLNRGSVRNAAGQWVSISSLAFGSVGATDLSLVSFNVPANGGVGGQGWSGWGPQVEVYVTGGKLRVDVAAALTASGNKFSMYMGYAIYGPSAAQGGAKALAVAAAYDRSIEVQHNSTGMDHRAAMGTFGLHTGLAAGWYLVQAQYACSYSNFTTAQYGDAANRRLLVTPY